MSPTRCKFYDKISLFPPTIFLSIIWLFHDLFFDLILFDFKYHCFCGSTPSLYSSDNNGPYLIRMLAELNESLE